MALRIHRKHQSICTSQQNISRGTKIPACGGHPKTKVRPTNAFHHEIPINAKRTVLAGRQDDTGAFPCDQIEQPDPVLAVGASPQVRNLVQIAGGCITIPKQVSGI